MGMLLNIWIIGMLLTFVWTMWTNHKASDEEKCNIMEMALGSVMWPFWVLWKIGHKLMGGGE
jgi:hypothetical protein